VVTVDYGIASVAEAEEARRLGLELIITDHHEPKDQLPAAAVHVHPRLPGTSYPFAGLSGAGVAFKVAWALCQRACASERVTPRFREFLVDGVALAALGLVADVMPLHDENRIFVRHGLHRLRQAPSVGLKALLDGAALGEKPTLLAADIGYKLAPRLNAAGRLGCARMVVELLTTPSAQRAIDLVRYLEGQNQQRQQIERRILSHARELVGDGALDDTPALVLASADWHPGIIGIVAGRLAELYARPALLIALRPECSETGGIGRGSGRSVPGVPLHEALQACAGHLLSHGGHAAAAGFTIRADAVDAFREQFCDHVARQFPTGPPAPQLVIDAEVPLSVLTPGLLSELDRLEPYGSQNPRPLFLAGDLQVVGTPNRMGNGERHINFRVRQQGTTLRAVAWSMSDRVEELMADGGRCCLVFTPRLNEWQGMRRVELEVVDLQAGPRARLT
jgi:single-stranded-DNA-specific exonuclease